MMISDQKSTGASRTHRKLPVIPASANRRQKMCSQSYRYAVNWFNKNCNTIDVALELLDMHPNLLNHSVCSKLKHFVNHARNGNNDVRVDIDTDNESRKQRDINLPEILVSQVQDVNSRFCVSHSELAETKTTHLEVCGDVQSEKWQRLVVDLCCKYSVSCVSPDSDVIQQRSDDYVFVFLLDSTSYNSDICRKALRQAYISSKPVLYVRDMEFEMLDNHFICHQSCCSVGEAVNTLRMDSYHRESDLKSVTSYNLSLPSRSSPRSSFSSRSNFGSTRSMSRSTDSGLGRSGCSSRNSFSPNKSPKLLDVADCRIEMDMNTNRPALTDDDHLNISKIIHAEYGMALTYHLLYHDTCTRRIQTVVSSKISQDAHDSSKLLSTTSVPMPRSQSAGSTLYDTSSTNRTSTFVDTSDYRPKPTFEFSRRRRSIAFVDDTVHVRRPSISTETVFLLSDPMSGDDPVIVHWPKDSSQQSISSSPSIDSFGFQEVDLSKRVNELDLFTDSEHD